jgi:hypothetical protein
MFKILGENYYLDLDEIEDFIKIENSSQTGTGENHISVVKYEMVKMLTEILLTESEEVDDNLGFKASNLSIPFKLSFNTLINKKLLNKY